MLTIKKYGRRWKPASVRKPHVRENDLMPKWIPILRRNEAKAGGRTTATSVAPTLEIERANAGRAGTRRLYRADRPPTRPRASGTAIPTQLAGLAAAIT
jgi:hypothetical protein